MKRLIKSTAVVALGTGVLLNAFPLTQHQTIAKAATQTAIDQVLAKLTPQQLQAIKQLKLTDKEGLQLSSDVDQTSDKLTSVIVEFKDKP
ncbi:hypothetical protein ACFCYN_22400, partial [Gottfriedia sp. NPDC056225]|uniref:hypothetical protein n=1 Tax=Gottfriedia sp. NPDC056225 TaxID=3345751 RepID=UPI0035DD532E